jgi:hypothetical protein
MLLPRATLLALTADHPPPAQPVAPARADGDYWLGHREVFKVQVVSVDARQARLDVRADGARRVSHRPTASRVGYGSGRDS